MNIRNQAKILEFLFMNIYEVENINILILCYTNTLYE